MCTLSENLRHDSFAICGHLGPIAKEIKNLIPNLHTVHFLSDGPTTQYKNKTMFFLIAVYLSKFFDAQVIRWHYSEPGHGKGAPDGIGGCLKRTADNLVAHGKDLHNFSTLIRELQDNCKGIKCYAISSSEINKVESDVCMPPDLKPFKGTMAVREIVWKQMSEDVLEARKLSCLICGTKICRHYSIGSINFLSLPKNKENTQKIISECNLFLSLLC